MRGREAGAGLNCPHVGWLPPGGACSVVAERSPQVRPQEELSSVYQGKEGLAGLVCAGADIQDAPDAPDLAAGQVPLDGQDGAQVAFAGEENVPSVQPGHRHPCSHPVPAPPAPAPGPSVALCGAALASPSPAAAATCPSLQHTKPHPLRALDRLFLHTFFNDPLLSLCRSPPGPFPSLKPAPAAGEIIFATCNCISVPESLITATLPWTIAPRGEGTPGLSCVSRHPGRRLGKSLVPSAPLSDYWREMSGGAGE